MVPNLLTAVGELAAVHQVNVSADVNGRVTEIKFEPGTHVEAGTPLVQLFDAPEQGDLANFKAQATVAQLSLDRAKQLASRQFGPQATVDTAQAAYDQAQAGIAKTEAVISQKLVRAPFAGDLGVRKVEVGQYLTAGTAIVSLTDLSELWANFTVTEKDSGNLKVGQTGAARRSTPIRAAPSMARSPRSSRRSRPTPATSACRRRSPIRTDPEARHVRDHHGGAAGQAGR